MSEIRARSHQYEYRANSNLVLQPERSRNNSEPTGEPETLWGHLHGRMGDRVAQERPKDLDEKLEKMKKRKKEKEKDQEEGPILKKHSGKSVLAATENLDQTYRPKTRESRVVYEQLLNFLQSRLGYQPQDVLRGAADEILAILKDEKFTAPAKKIQTEKLLNVMSDNDFTVLSGICRNIKDYGEEDKSKAESSSEKKADNLDDETGVAVVFEQLDQDEEDQEDYELKDESDEEDAATGDGEGTLKSLHAEGGEEEFDDDGKRKTNKTPYDLNARDIDAFWLQRRVSSFESDPVQAQKLAESVMKTLQEADDRQAENELVLQLGFDRFELIKVLLKNRLKVVYCVRLARAANEEERQSIEEEMIESPELLSILQTLKGERSNNQPTLASSSSETRSSLKGKIASKIDTSSLTSNAPRSLDLESLSFAQGGHLMSNRQCVLPSKSYRKTRKGYEEVFVPAFQPPPWGDDEVLVDISSMPEWARAAFDGMTKLTRVQSRLYNAAFNGAQNLLLCAPTGAGKTNVAMLCILHEMGLHMKGGVVDKESFKVIYIAPMKSLVAEMVGNFSRRLKDYGISVKELSGDQSLTKKQISETQIIVTTPEKWDIITRKSGDRTYTELVRLIIFDEIHLLHDDRGPVIESIVARTIRHIEETQEMVRLVGLSATLPNYEDVATLLRVEQNGLFVFDNSYRPVPLEQQYIGITEKKALKRFQLMNEITYEKVMERAGESQILIFVHSRKETVKTARAIRDMALANDQLGKFLGSSSATREILQYTADNEIKNSDLKELLPYGFAVHHAGLARTDRQAVEDLFSQKEKHIQVLVSTATLAWGVNLPAHTVIIKGTQIYNPEKGKWCELSPMDIMQMIGRAGRPAYDKEGEGIIITSHTELQYYLSLLNQQLPIESQFISKLPDNLNAEIVLGSIQNVSEAVTWLGYTYLYICMLRNPTLYGISVDEFEKDRLLEKRRYDLIHTAATILDKSNLIKYDRKSGIFQVTDLGRVASHYYISHHSMSTYNEHLKPTMGDIEIFRLFSLSNEFKQVAVREEERTEMEKLLERVPIPIKESLDEPSAKINVLLQTYISRLKLDGLALISDMVYVTQSAGRILRALFEIVLKRGWAQLALKILQVAKIVDRRMWATQTPLRQFKDMPEELLKKLEQKDFPMSRLYDLNSQELGELVSFPQLGKNLHRHIHNFPKLELSAYVQPITRSILKIELNIHPDFQYEEKYHGNALSFYILVEDVDGEVILHSEYFILKKKLATEDHTVSFTVPLFEPLPPQYFIRIVSDRWIGCESVLPVSFRDLILPEKYPPQTELLDLQPLPVAALKNKGYEHFYNFKFFNAIQTQVFQTIFNSDENVLLAAPSGSGKTVAAEFAIMRMFNKNEEESKVIYVAPLQAIAVERYNDWREKFGKLGRKVVLLTGDINVDVLLLDRCDIAITTAEKWDVFSRRWKNRKPLFKTIKLFIVDELHLIGGDKGHTLEIVCSRMRYISAQTGNAIRVVALSSSLANSRDLGEWIGATHHSLFNFHPNVRPVPLEIHLQGFDIPNFSARMMAMSKPMINAVINHGKTKPIIIFVPTRKQCGKTAKDLLTFVSALDASGVSSVQRRFLHVSEQDLAPYLNEIDNLVLKESLSFGVAFYHEGLTVKERTIVETLFESGAIQVLVSTYDLAWGMKMSAHLVVIMGTQSYQGKEQGYGDYPITDILQMMGRSGRPSKDDLGKCIILCHAAKKEYYKKFLYEPLPVESHLDHFLADHFNAEIVNKTIVNKQDAMDYLTWTFLYRRFSQNPNYYGLKGVTNRHLSEKMSVLVEDTIEELETAKCVSIENEMDLTALNLGIISSYYYLRYTTIDLFNNSVSATTKIKGIVEIIANATEYDTLPIRHGEDGILQRLVNHLPMKVEKHKHGDPHTKALILLLAHFTRRPLTADLYQDQMEVVETASRLILAIVDVITSSRWLKPALAAMELSQMVTQAVWESNDSVLRQLPHMTEERIKRCLDNKIENVFDLNDLEDADRAKLLGMTKSELNDLAKFSSKYPDIELQYTINDEDDIHAGDEVLVDVQLKRQLDDDEEIEAVIAPFYPKEKMDGWWVLIGDTKSNEVLAIKRVNLGKTGKAKLDFVASEMGDHTYHLYFMCDSYNGCDQEYEIKLNVKSANMETD